MNYKNKDYKIAILELALTYACEAINEKYTIPFGSDKQYRKMFIEKAENKLRGKINERN